MPKISIVTINRNNAEGLEKTIRSVIEQVYDNYEYIIIDGASSDSSIDIIKKYSNSIGYWISEPDKGVYDAMNKGASIATGDWICFMNSGDVFCNKEVLQNVFVEDQNLVLASDVIYGDTVLVTHSVKFVPRIAPLESILIDKPFCHQSCFVKTSLQKEYKFDLRYKICADHAFFLSLYKNKYRFNYINRLISNFDTIDSMSSVNTNLVVRENYKVIGKSEDMKMYFDILKLKIQKPLSCMLDVLCSKVDFLAKNKERRMRKRPDVMWVMKK